MLVMVISDVIFGKKERMGDMVLNFEFQKWFYCLYIEGIFSDYIFLSLRNDFSLYEVFFSLKKNGKFY